MSDANHDPDDLDDQPRHSGLEAKLAAIVTGPLEGMGYELVRVAVLGRDRPTVQVMADRADQAPFTVDDCEAISHALGAVIDVEDPIKTNWTLEVSSAGIDRPLTRRKDWTRHLGHQARVELEIPQNGRRRLVGAIVDAGPHEATVRLPDGSDVAVPYDNVRRAKLVLTDELIAASLRAAKLPETPDPLIH